MGLDCDLIRVVEQQKVSTSRIGLLNYNEKALGRTMSNKEKNHPIKKHVLIDIASDCALHLNTNFLRIFLPEHRPSASFDYQSHQPPSILSRNVTCCATQWRAKAFNLLSHRHFFCARQRKTDSSQRYLTTAQDGS